MAVMNMITARVGSSHGGCGCGSEARSGQLERLRYFQRQLLTADDMVAEQDYFREKLRRHNRYLHGWGVVCGLEVTAAPTEAAPWRVRVGEGYALTPPGDEIAVVEAAFLDLAECGPGAETDPCEPSRLRPMPLRGDAVFVAIKYAECLSKPVRSSVACGCDDASCEYSRVRDSFALECLEQIPPSHRTPAPSLCDAITRRTIVPCPPVETDPWLVLARVSLPVSREVDVANADIDNLTVRRQLYSTYVLQEQLIRCCCGGHKPDEEPKAVPVRVLTFSPENEQAFTNVGPESLAATFDKDVQPSTVSTATFVVSKEGSSSAIPGTVTYDAPSRTAKFVPAKRFTVAKYDVVIKGSGPSHITDADALALDGDKDGEGGDDFKSTFTVKKPT